MKLFKKVIFLSLVILSLGSSVAFGDCPGSHSSDVSVSTVPNKDAPAVAVDKDGKPVQSGTIKQ